MTDNIAMTNADDRPKITVDQDILALISEQGIESTVSLLQTLQRILEDPAGGDYRHIKAKQRLRTPWPGWSQTGKLIDAFFEARGITLVDATTDLATFGELKKEAIESDLDNSSYVRTSWNYIRNIMFVMPQIEEMLRDDPTSSIESIGILGDFIERIAVDNKNSPQSISYESLRADKAQFIARVLTTMEEKRQHPAFEWWCNFLKKEFDLPRSLDDKYTAIKSKIKVGVKADTYRNIVTVVGAVLEAAGVSLADYADNPETIRDKYLEDHFLLSNKDSLDVLDHLTRFFKEEKSIDSATEPADNIDALFPPYPAGPRIPNLNFRPNPTITRLIQKDPTITTVALLLQRVSPNDNEGGPMARRADNGSIFDDFIGEIDFGEILQSSLTFLDHTDKWIEEANKQYTPDKKSVRWLRAVSSYVGVIQRICCKVPLEEEIRGKDDDHYVRACARHFVRFLENGGISFDELKKNPSQLAGRILQIIHERPIVNSEIHFIKLRKHLMHHDLDDHVEQLIADMKGDRAKKTARTEISLVATYLMLRGPEYYKQYKRAPENFEDDIKRHLSAYVSFSSAIGTLKRLREKLPVKVEIEDQEHTPQQYAVMVERAGPSTAETAFYHGSGTATAFAENRAGHVVPSGLDIHIDTDTPPTIVKHLDEYEALNHVFFSRASENGRWVESQFRMNGKGNEQKFSPKVKNEPMQFKFLEHSVNAMWESRQRSMDKGWFKDDPTTKDAYIQSRVDAVLNAIDATRNGRVPNSSNFFLSVQIDESHVTKADRSVARNGFLGQGVIAIAEQTESQVLIYAALRSANATAYKSLEERFGEDNVESCSVRVNQDNPDDPNAHEHWMAFGCGNDAVRINGSFRKGLSYIGGADFLFEEGELTIKNKYFKDVVYRIAIYNQVRPVKVNRHAKSFYGEHYRLNLSLPDIKHEPHEKALDTTDHVPLITRCAIDNWLTKNQLKELNKIYGVGKWKVVSPLGNVGSLSSDTVHAKEIGASNDGSVESFLIQQNTLQNGNGLAEVVYIRKDHINGGNNKWKAIQEALNNGDELPAISLSGVQQNDLHTYQGNAATTRTQRAMRRQRTNNEENKEALKRARLRK